MVHLILQPLILFSLYFDLVCVAQGGSVYLGLIIQVCSMFFKFNLRHNTTSNSFDRYYRLMESYRGIDGKCTQKTLLTIGVWNDVQPAQLNKISSHLNQLEKGCQSLFEEQDIYIKQQVQKLWHDLIAKGKVDAPEVAKSKREN